jgi:hypothetical protein
MDTLSEAPDGVTGLRRPAFVGTTRTSLIVMLLWSCLVIGLAIGPSTDPWSWLVVAGAGALYVFATGWVKDRRLRRAIRRLKTPTPGIRPPQDRVYSTAYVVGTQAILVGVPVSVALGQARAVFGAIGVVLFGLAAYSAIFGLLVARQETRSGMGVLVSKRRPHVVYGFSLAGPVTSGAPGRGERQSVAADLAAREPYLND